MYEQNPDGVTTNPPFISSFIAMKIVTLEDKKKWVKEDEKIIAVRAVNHASKCQRLTTET